MIYRTCIHKFTNMQKYYRNEHGEFILGDIHIMAKLCVHDNIMWMVGVVIHLHVI